MKPTKQELEELYINQNKNMEYIANKYGTYRMIVSNWLKDFNIEIKSPYSKKLIPEKHILEKLYNDGKTFRDIGNIFDASENLVSKWFKEYNIDVKLVTDRIFEIPNKEYLIELYKTLTIKQIAYHYGVSCETARRWFLHYNIQLDSNQRKFAHLRAIPLTNLQHDYLIGVMLGDGFLSRGGKKSGTRLNISHSNKQFDYFLYNKKLFNNFVNNVYEIKRIDKRTGNEYHGWTFTSITHHGMNKIHSMFYSNHKKIVPHNIANYLNPFVMAIWIMDDGWLNSSIKISSEGFTKKENEILSFAIKTCFEINSKVCEYSRRGKKYYYLSFNKENSIKLTKLIEPFVIESMKYKLFRSSTTKCQTPKRDEDIV